MFDCDFFLGKEDMSVFTARGENNNKQRDY